MTTSEIPVDPGFGFLERVYLEHGLGFVKSPSELQKRDHADSVAHGLVEALKEHGADFPILEIADPRGMLKVIPVQFRAIEFRGVQTRNLLDANAEPVAGHTGKANLVSPSPDDPEENIFLGTAKVTQLGEADYFNSLRLARSSGVPDQIYMSPEVHGTGHNPYTDNPEAMNFISFIGSYLENLGTA